MPGFWSSVKSGFKKAANWIGEKIEQAGRFIQESLSDLSKSDSGPSVNWTDVTSKPASDTTNEEERKKRLQRENELIDEYQKKVKKKAKKREDEIINKYLGIYQKYIEAFSPILGDELINNIRDYINQTSNAFANTIRDEVNTKVGRSYHEWRQLISSHPRPEQLNNYCDRIYTEAENNLIDLLQESIEDTNKYISERIIKYNDDRARALKAMKESLKQLTSDEETKAQELKKIAEELAVVSFIAHEASIDID